MTVLLALLRVASAGTCPHATSADELHRAAAAAAAAYYTLDQARFEDSLELVLSRLGCLSVEIDPILAAEIHRVVGLGAWLDRSSDRTAQAFAAARWGDPSWGFTPGTLPAEAPERALFEGITPGPAQGRALPQTNRGALSLDGVAGAERPVDRPAILQVRAADGRLVDTRYLWPDEPLPDTVSSRPISRPVIFAGASGVLALTGGVVACIGGIRSLDPDFREASAFGDPAAVDHWRRGIVPWYAVGGTLAGLGGLGLAGVGVWVAVADPTAIVGVRGEW